MTFGTLIRRSLRFHWRSHLGVVLGAAIGSAALIGALVVGDSVKGSLKESATKRLAGAAVAMDTGDRFFRVDLLQRMCEISSNRVFQAQRTGADAGMVWGGELASKFDRVMLHLPGNVSRGDGLARVNAVNVIGVSDWIVKRYLDFSGETSADGTVVWLNLEAARRLLTTTNDELIIRLQKPTALAGDAALAQRNESAIVVRARVAGTASQSIADLALENSQRPAANIFIRRSQLASAIGLEERANLFLGEEAAGWRKMGMWERFNLHYTLWRIGVSKNPFRDLSWLKPSSEQGDMSRASPAETVSVIQSLLHEVWRLDDAQISWAQVGATSNNINWRSLEVRTPRIFLDSAVIDAAHRSNSNTQPVLTYLVNLFQAGTNATPYSMATAAGAPWTPADLRDDEIVVSQWLGDDLQVKPGDEIALVYFDPESGARLVEHTNTFRVRSIVPMEMPWADRTLMPDFPGIEKAESTSEWDAGFPLTYKVRTKDDDYWKQYRGTPKAFITLAAGQKMWGNRFGNLTAIRFPIPTNVVGTLSTASQTSSENNRDAVRRVPASTEEYRAALEKKILANLRPEELGLRFEPVREQALKAAEESQDFGGLFLGFSFFVIAAALLLMALLFSLGLEQRAPEIGTLLALGFTPKQVRKILLREAVVLSLIGGVIGALGGLAYARAMLHGLTTIWRDAVGASALSFHFTAQTLVIGIFASAVVSVVTIWLTLRKFVKRPARELLVGEVGGDESKVQSLKAKVIAVASLLAGLVLAGWAVVTGDTANAGIFFGAGALILIAGLSFASAWLARRTGVAPVSNISGVSDGDRRDACPTLASLAVRGCARRRKRSLATVAMLACGSFLLVSIGVFRLDANRDATKKASGTGGFALIGETTMPVVHDLNAASGRDFFALNERDLEGVNIVPFRVREGDEASCLNLNRAQKPRLLGVKPEMLEGRFGFTKGEGWRALQEDRGWKIEDGRSTEHSDTAQPSSTVHPPSSSPEIPAIGDANSIQWAMGKKVGDTLDYVDERGQPFKVRIVGAVANSILQGQLIIDETEFVKRFPGESGYRMFLLDAPSNAVSQVAAMLSRAMQDVGLELTPAPQRLAQFNAVQNTYLGTFQVLGGLGLLLGSVGLGIVVLRNVLERRGELALLIAVGFRKQQLQRLLLLENGALLATGLSLGVVAATVAVLPALLSPGAQLPYASLTLTLGAVLMNGAVWTWAATRFAVRGDLLKALRNE